MQNIGIQTALASSFLALLVVLSSQTLDTNKELLVASTMCINEFTQEPCMCGSTECYENPDGSTNNPPPEVCYNEYTQDECECGSTECEHNPTEETSDTTEIGFDMNIDCPFPQQSNRKILDFTNGGTIPARYLAIQADMGFEESSKGRSAEISPGVYKIHLASYHHSESTASTGGNNERWRLELYDTSKSLLLRTEPTHYVGYDEILVKETVEITAELHAPSYKVVAKHEAFPNSQPFRFAPLCAAFDLIDDITAPVTETEEIADYAGTDTEVEVVTDDETDSEDSTATNPYLNTSMRCPLERREGRIIVDFTKGGTIPISNLRIASDDSLSYKEGPVSTSLPIGEYTVRFSSYGHNLSETDQSHQEWKLKLMNSDRKVVAETPPSKDIPSYITSDFTQKISEDFIIKDTVKSVAAIHNRYREDDPNTVAVLCAAFDYHGDIPNYEEPSDVDTDVETYNEESQPEPRDVFVPYEDQQDGTVDTRTTVYMPPNEEDMVESSPQTIGIETDNETIVVDEEVVHVRTDFVSQYEDTPFNKILTASREEREVLAEKLLVQPKEGEETSEPPQRITLTRIVSEEVGEVIQKEIDEDEDLAFESFRVKKRNELGTNEDKDGDGVTDYDELHLYKTNPTNPFTSGSTLTDGERILLGLNPLDRSTAPLPVLSPKQTGEEVKGLYRVENIELLSEEETEKESIRLQGQAEPYAFVTLFVYSTPIVVTVRADNEGKFEYTFDETLEDGSHEVYVTSVNNTGKILAKSQPIPFVKTAQAIEYVPIAAAHQADPVNSSMKTAITLLFILVLLLTISVVGWLGYMKSHQKITVSEEINQTSEDEEA